MIALGMQNMSDRRQGILTVAHHSIAERVIRQFHAFRYRCNRQDFAIKDNASGAARVPRLGFMGRPNTVLRAIVAIIVDTLKRALLGAWAHVCKKPLEVISPFITYDDAAATIVLVVRGISDVTARLHVLPRLVFSTDTRISRMAMARPCSLAMQAPTTPGMVHPQAIGANDYYCSAIASTTPPNWAGAWNTLQCDQPGEANARQVHEWRHESRESLPY